MMTGSTQGRKAPRAQDDAGTSRAMVTDLPVQVRVAIDLVAASGGGVSGAIRGRVVGDTRLVEELARYAPILDSPRRLIALGAVPHELHVVLATDRPEFVTTVVEG